MAFDLRTFTCDCEGDGMPGVLAPMYPDGDAAHLFVQACDGCGRYPHDDAAAHALAEHLKLNVRRRYDDDSLRYWRPFVARPDSHDDADTYGIGADDFGCFPEKEVPCGS
jgi:hypothetical protein